MEPTPENIQMATQRLHQAFMRCVSGQGSMEDWQLLHVAIFGAPFQIVTSKQETEG